MEMNARKQEILYRIVENFIKTGVPVGSEFLYNTYKFGIKSATIRKEMAEMEKMGYLTHSYTSSGRIPTDKGYRFYVDLLLKNEKICEQKKNDMENYIKKYEFSSSEELEKIIEKAGKLLVEITKYIVLISFPEPSQEVLKHIELILLRPTKILSVIVTTTGAVYRKIFSAPEIITPEMLEKISRVLNNKLTGLTFEKIMFSPLGEVEEEIVFKTNLFRQVVRDLINKILVAERKEDLLYEGIEYLLKEKEFKNYEKLQKILRFTFQKRVLYNYLKECIEENLDEIKVLIGKENKYQEMEDLSLVMTNYKLNPRNYGIIAILGPKRMAYSRVFFGIKFISNILNETFEKMTFGR
jgi:heat-inducible transcriptional repressor